MPELQEAAVASEQTWQLSTDAMPCAPTDPLERPRSHDHDRPQSESTGSRRRRSGSRDRVEIKSVESKLIKDWNAESAGAWSGGVGYIHANNFDRNTYKSLRRNLNQLRESNDGKPLAGLILDLRNNSGGLLSQAISMADTFLKKGEIVGTAYKSQEPDYRSAKASGTCLLYTSPSPRDA